MDHGTRQLGIEVRHQFRTFSGGGKGHIAQRLIVDPQTAAVRARAVQADQAEAGLRRAWQALNPRAALPCNSAVPRNAGIFLADDLKLGQRHGVAVHLKTQLAVSELAGLVLIARLEGDALGAGRQLRIAPISTVCSRNNRPCR